ncbi:MAG: HD domain-containing protein [Gemmatimonadota bacterium]|jgi:guanosine-3',5'-bis(diphosphate) 3'-pyrophosphohydrolase|nr:HD domain-containing protein [Gemmatimonadota bacterium]
MPAPLAALLNALQLAAERHRTQRRKGEDAPYVNHLVEVAALLAREGGVADVEVLQAAVLHDTLEDTETRAAEIERRFGERVRRLVEEMTDPPGVADAEQKRLQEEHAPHLSADAKRIKIADKVSNVRDLPNRPWTAERKREYLYWTEQVVRGCRGASTPLEECYDRALREARERVERDA